MKTLIATAALAVILASPALAQTAQRRAPSQPTISQTEQYGRSEAQQRAGGSTSVYDGGRYLGADPDPNVRLNLRMDWEHHD